MKTLVLLILSLLAPGLRATVATPTGLTVTSIQTDQSATLSWNEDPVVTQWYIYLDGSLVYQPFRDNTMLNGSQRRFIMTYLPFRSPIVVNMKALAPPQPISGTSLSVSTYAQPNNGTLVYTTSTVSVTCISGCSGPVTNSAATAVSVIAGVAGVSVTAAQLGAWSLVTAGNVSLNAGTSIIGSVGITNSVKVQQDSPWTVSGSVGISSFPNSYIGVSVFAGVAGVSVTASQGSPWTVSGSVSTAGNVSLNAGTDIIGAVGVTNPVNVLQASPWTVSGSVGISSFPTSYVGVSVFSGVAGVSVTASQGSPWTVSGSVSTAGNVSLTAGTATIGNVGVTNSVKVIQDSPWTVSGSVSTAGNVSLNAGTQIIGAVGVTNPVNVLQASPWTVSGSVGVSSFPAAYLGVSVVSGAAGISVTASQGSPWTVSGSVSTAGNVSLNAGTFYIGAIGVTNSVGLAVSVIAGVAGVSVTAAQLGTWNLGTAGNVSLNAGTSIVGAVGVTNSVKVQQDSPWTVSGSVALGAGVAYIGAIGVTNSVGLAVSVIAGVSGVSVTAVQSGTWNLGTAGNVSLNAGTFYIGAIGVSNSVGLAVTNLAGVAYIGAIGVTNSVGLAVSVIAGVAGVSVTAVQSGTWFAALSNPASVTANITAAGQSVTITCFGLPTVSYQFTAVGTGATVIGETSQDGGTSWTQVPINYYASAGALPVQGASQANPLSFTVITFPTNGAGLARLRASAFTGGTYTINGVPEYTQAFASNYLLPGVNYVGAIGVSNSVGLAVTNLAGVAYIGAIGVTNSVGLAVSVIAGVAGVSVTAVQSGTWNLATAGNVSINAGTSIIGAVGVTNSVKVQQDSPWTVSGSVSTAGNVSLNAGTFYVGAIGITNSVGLAVTNLAGVAYIGAVGITNSVGLAVTVLAGTNYIGAVGITNSVGLAVTILAGTNTIGNVGITSTVRVIPFGSDANLPIYTTVTAASLPTVPYYLNQSGPGYEYGVCTTCTAGARFVAFVRPNGSFLTTVTCAVTQSTGVQGVSMCFLTPAARTKTTIYNPTASGKVIRYVEWKNAVAPLVSSASLQEITPSGEVTIVDSLPYLHIFSPGGTPSVAPLVNHITDTTWTGTSYP